MRKLGIFLFLTILVLITGNVQDMKASQVREVVYLRTNNSKVYDMGDGVYQYQYFKNDIHYYTQEGYKEYNQTLEYNNSSGRYDTQYNNYNVSLPVMSEYEQLFSTSLNYEDNNKVLITYYDLYQMEIEYTNEMSYAKYSDNQIHIADRSSNVSSLHLEPLNQSLSERFISETSHNDSITYYIYTDELSLLEVEGEYHFIDKANASIFSIGNYYSRGANGQFFFGNKTNVIEIESGVYEVEVILDQTISQSSDEVYPVTTYGGVTYSLVSTPSGIRDKTIIQDTNVEYDVDYFTVSKQTLMPAPAGSIPYLPVYNLYSIMELDFSDISGSNITVLDAKLTIQRESSNVNTKVPVSLITSSITFDDITGNSSYTKTLLSQSSIYTDLMVYDITQEVSDEMSNGDKSLLIEFSPEMIILKTSSMKYMHFFSENSSTEQSPYFTVDVEGITLSSDYGDAPIYSDVLTTDPNCFGYSLRINNTLNITTSAGDIDFSNINVTNDYYYKVIVPAVLYTINNQQFVSGRILPNLNAQVSVNEYRIALRVGNVEETTKTFYTFPSGYGPVIKNEDFHFMMQLSDGKWGHKVGNLPSEYLGNVVNPSSVDWDAPYPYISGDYFPNHYNSPTVYFAVINTKTD